MTQWAETEAEMILDRLTLYDFPDGRWYEMGRTDTLPDEFAF